jgi:hypothetical protein
MRAKRYIAPVLRLMAFIGVCAAVLLYVDYRVARASVMEKLLGIGQRMAPFLDDAHGIEAPREVHMNGLRMWVAAGHTEHRTEEVRRWYSERYAGKGSVNDVITDELKKIKMIPPTVDGLSQAQFGDDERGGMAAIDMGSNVTFKMILSRMHQLAAGKIGEFGHLRYLYYERTSTGGTRYLTIWSDDTFDLTKFLPNGSEDTPGRDLEDVPRYPGTVRVLSADERGRSAQVVVYGGPGSPDGAEMFFAARMRTLGWQDDPLYANAASRNGLHSHRWQNAKGHEVVLDLADAKTRGDVIVTAIQLH